MPLYLPPSAGEGVPTGGISPQVLTKNSATDFDTSWQDASGGFPLTVTTPSTTTVSETDPFAGTWPTATDIIIWGYGTAGDFTSTPAYAETPRVVGDEAIYVEYYSPPVAVAGPGELWEFGVQLGIEYGVGPDPTTFMAVAVLPLSLNNIDEVETHQYPPFIADGINGYTRPPDATNPWIGMITSTMVSGAADAKLLLGVGLYFVGTGTGPISVYGGSTYSRRLA